MGKDLPTMQKILVVVHESENPNNAATHAISIAEKFGAEVIVLDIVETQPWLHGRYPYAWPSPEKNEQVYAEEKKRAQSALDMIAKEAARHNVNARSEVLLSPTNISRRLVISRYAKKEGVDIIILGSRRSSVLAKLGLENNGTEAISAESDVPVMIIP